ncbi:unannotated protein [freshwater metagenome]|uniref:Unannotated protein n=1 Tax=freshwater metagenome TaxID=449393 RepID=A0A6J7W660_9ZZZZ
MGPATPVVAIAHVVEKDFMAPRAISIATFSLIALCCSRTPASTPRCEIFISSLYAVIPPTKTSDAPEILTIAELTAPAVKDSAVLTVSPRERRTSIISVASSIISDGSAMSA